MPSQENKTMSTNPVRRPLPIAAPSAPPPVFAIASSYEPRRVQADAHVPDRRRHMRVAPAAIALVLLFMCGVIALLLYLERL
jgi:hypothetical protein